MHVFRVISVIVVLVKPSHVRVVVVVVVVRDLNVDGLFGTVFP
jgi:hypothetical protein